jgi:hypothetical protein
MGTGTPIGTYLLRLMHIPDTKFPNKTLYLSSGDRLSSRCTVRRLCNLAEPGALWHVAVTLTRQTPQTQKSAMLSVPARQSLRQFAVYKT